jgi:hypothetical protein
VSDYRHLQDLPDYLLDDIGLTSSEVDMASRRHLFRGVAGAGTAEGRKFSGWLQFYRFV